MKRILASLLAAVCLFSITGCGQFTEEDYEQPGGLFSKKTTAAVTTSSAPDTTTTSADMDQFRMYQLSEKYNYILRDFGHWDSKEDVLNKMDNTYNNICNYYSSLLDDLISSQPFAGRTTFITGKSFNDLMKYSPLAYELYQYRNKLSINPVIAVDSLTRISRHKNSPDKFIHYYADRSSAVRNAKVFKTPEQFIKDSLRAYVAPLNYEVNYSSAENLYYVYLISAEENISASAIYFSFEDNVLKRIGIDNMIYTGGQLAIVDSSQKFAHEKPLNEDMSNNGAYIYYGSEKTTLNNLMDMATSMLGSSSNNRDLISAGKVTSEDTFRPDFVVTSDDSSYGIKGIYYSTWFTIS
jgi:hypothetical protein